jgi:hypothetical protein
MTKSSKLQLIAVIPLILTAFDNYTQSNFLNFYINLIAALVNISVIKFIDQRPTFINILLSLINALMAFFNAYDYYINGKKYLPLAYVIVGIVFIFSIFIYVRKTNKNINL